LITTCKHFNKKYSFLDLLVDVLLQALGGMLLKEFLLNKFTFIF